MAAKKARQTMEKHRREQAVRKKREDKALRKAEARAAKLAGPVDTDIAEGDDNAAEGDDNAAEGDDNAAEGDDVAAEGEDTTSPEVAPADDENPQDAPHAATVEATKNGSGLRDAPSHHVHL